MATTKITIHVDDPDGAPPVVKSVEFDGKAAPKKTPHAAAQALQIDIVTPPGVGGGDCVMSGGFMWCPP